MYIRGYCKDEAIKISCPEIQHPRRKLKLFPFIVIYAAFWIVITLICALLKITFFIIFSSLTRCVHYLRQIYYLYSWDARTHKKFKCIARLPKRVIEIHLWNNSPEIQNFDYKFWIFVIIKKKKSILNPKSLSLNIKEQSLNVRAEWFYYKPQTRKDTRHGTSTCSLGSRV